MGRLAGTALAIVVVATAAGTVIGLSAWSEAHKDSRTSGVTVCVDSALVRECLPLEQFRQRERNKAEAYRAAR